MSSNILLLGATGVSGQAFIEIALKQADPPSLTLYVRSRTKLPAGIEEHARVRVVEGSLNNERALADAMTGVDTVVSVLGAYPSLSYFISRSKPTPIADAFPGIISAMRIAGARRLFALSTPSFTPDPTETSPLRWSLYGLLAPAIVPQGNAEMVGIGRAVAAADDIEWTVFRVPYLSQQAADLPVVAGPLGPDFKGGISLSRASMAVWILKEIEERKWVKKSPVLANF